MNIPRSAALSLLLTITTSAAAAPALQPKLEEAEAFGETYTLVVDLKSQGYLQAQLVISNLGPGTAKAACRFMMLGPHAVSDELSVEREAWSFQAASDTLKVGPCSLQASGKGLVLNAPLKKAKLSITLPGAVTPVRPPDGRITAGDSFYEVAVLKPASAAEVTLTPAGGAPKKLSGFGYADHSRSTVLPSDIARRWVRFRALDPEHAQLLLIRYPPGRGGPISWRWDQGKKAPVALRGVKIRKKAGNWELRVPGTPLGLLRSGRLLKRSAPVEEHGLLGRIASAVVGNPVTYTYRAQLLRKGLPPIPGIMELTVVNEAR